MQSDSVVQNINSISARLILLVPIVYKVQKRYDLNPSQFCIYSDLDKLQTNGAVPTFCDHLNNRVMELILLQNMQIFKRV